eukprot:1484-Heterococcus_DN1.PRE.1
MRAVMRSTLVDWLVEVCAEYKLQPGTLYLVVDLLDRCLSLFAVPRDRLQLLGCACLLVAAKFEEEHPPAVNALVYISENTYTHREVVDMELQVVQQLKFRITSITPYHFVGRFAAAAACDERQQELANYLLELALQDYTLILFLPSLKAAAAVLLAKQTMCRRGTAVWSQQAEHYSGYEACDLEVCVRRMRVLHQGAEDSKLRAVRDKYCKPARHSVALLCCIADEDLCFDTE